MFTIVFLSVVLVIFVFITAALFANKENGAGILSFVVVFLCVLGIITEVFEKTYYIADCNGIAYSVYEENNNYYLTETDAKIILPNCVLIENQSD